MKGDVKMKINKAVVIAMALFGLLVSGLGSGGLIFARTPPQQPTPANLNPADFVAVIDNPYLPLSPGTSFIYEGKIEEGFEDIEMKVLSEPRQVMGIAATVLEETAYAD